MSAEHRIIGPSVGDCVGNYRLTRRIGRGGMAVVYLAEHALLARKAAIKLLRPELSRLESTVDRFFEEARVTSTIRHPGVVEVFDFGFTDDGIAFLVMEHLEGETLRERLHRHGPLAPGCAIAFASSLASVLAAAHRAGIIHRDLKPENVFLIPDPLSQRAERIKLFDFGIACRADEGAEPRKETSPDVVLGTPAYMSPEQCCDDPTDGRSDLYSLGCVLFEMLTGEPPFPGTGTEVVLAQVQQRPPAPSSKITGLDARLDDLVLELLAKDPVLRTPTADAVLAALHDLDWGAYDNGASRSPRRLSAGTSTRPSGGRRKRLELRKTNPFVRAEGTFDRVLEEYPTWDGLTEPLAAGDKKRTVPNVVFRPRRLRKPSA